MTITDGCLCGQVRWTATAEPFVTRACWCRLCQSIGAGSGTVNAGFPSEAVTVEGETRDFAAVADSGNVMHRLFCPSCGVHLFSQAEVRRHQLFIRVGTFDDPNLTRPEMTIWTAQAPTWACIDETIPSQPGQPAPAALAQPDGGKPYLT